MNRKLRNILWIVLLFLLCFPIGYVAMIISKPHTRHIDYLPITLGIGSILFLLFGFISWLVYYFTKRKNANDPAKIALIVFSCLLFAGMAGNAPKYNSAMKEKNRYDFMEGFREAMYNGIEDGFKSNPAIPKEIKQHSRDISDCIYYKVKANDALIDEAMTVPDPETFAMTSPDMKKIVEDCMAEYLSLIK